MLLKWFGFLQPYGCSLKPHSLANTPCLSTPNKVSNPSFVIELKVFVRNREERLVQKLQKGAKFYWWIIHHHRGGMTFYLSQFETKILLKQYPKVV